MMQISNRAAYPSQPIAPVATGGGTPVSKQAVQADSWASSRVKAGGGNPPATVAPASASFSVTQVLQSVANVILSALSWVVNLFKAPASTPAQPPSSPAPTPVPTPAVPTPGFSATPPSPTPAPSAPAASAASGPVGVPGDWKMTFEDKFNGPEQWGQVWSNSWGNRWTMNNVVTDPANVKVENGQAELTLANSKSGAMMTTNKDDGGGGFMMGYGYAEARIKLPVKDGKIVGWPAWWTSGDNWPKGGEADILEAMGGSATSNYHYTNVDDNSGPLPTTATDGEWHTFGLDREPGVNKIYWDGKLVRTYATKDDGAPQALLLNIGQGFGAPQVDGATMDVDYVRVWQRNS